MGVFGFPTAAVSIISNGLNKAIKNSQKTTKSSSVTSTKKKNTKDTDKRKQNLV